MCNSGVSRETYRDAVKSGEDIPWKCESSSVSSANSYLTSRVRGTKVTKIFTVIFGGKGRDVATCTQQRTKKSVKDCKIEYFTSQKLTKVLCRFNFNT